MLQIQTCISLMTRLLWLWNFVDFRLTCECHRICLPV